MILMVPFEPWHIDSLLSDMRDYDRGRMEIHGGEREFRKLCAAMLKCSMANTFVLDDRAVAIWFTAQRGPGCVTIFSYTANAVDEHPLDFMRACKLSIETLQETFNLHRAEAFVDKNYTKSIKWLKRLGFEVEGTLRQYNIDKTDAVIMGRVW